ncbi:hypothetical protein OBBRIDRAFT_489999 [Obba rivulosa]|uniref:Uncharacterized protein n=1 Tax=Obba rivulosa TaxID=1052685 RepID=A0A8E2DKW9_9APHY|nr:hypothetical protein OBBRIDRAFT_489999 [Obba rivulosa]
MKDVCNCLRFLPRVCYSGSIHDIESEQCSWSSILREHAKDPLLLRSLVFVLWILDCVHMALVMIAVYHYQVTNFENILILLKPHWSISSIPIVTTMTTGIIRGIFAYRLWKLGAGARTVPIIIIVASLFILGDATYFSAKEFFWPAWSSVSQYSWCLYAGFGCEIAVDSIITITQYQFMTRLQRGTTFRSTSSVVNLLVMYSINSCLLTGTCAVCTMITLVWYVPRYFHIYRLLLRIVKIVYQCPACQFERAQLPPEESHEDHPQNGRNAHRFWHRFII